MLQITKKAHRLREEVKLAIKLLIDIQDELSNPEKDKEWLDKIKQTLIFKPKFVFMQEDMWAISKIFFRVHIKEISVDQAKKKINEAIEELRSIK